MCEAILRATSFLIINNSLFKSKFDPDEDEGFWGNRDIIISNLDKVYIYLRRHDDDKYNYEILGWYLLEKKFDKQYIHMFQSFIERKGYAREMFEHINKTSDDVYVYNITNNSYKFWKHIGVMDIQYDNWYFYNCQDINTYCNFLRNELNYDHDIIAEIQLDSENK
jgi:hypothetical protein